MKSPSYKLECGVPVALHQSLCKYHHHHHHWVCFRTSLLFFSLRVVCDPNWSMASVAWNSVALTDLSKLVNVERNALPYIVADFLLHVLQLLLRCIRWTRSVSTCLKAATFGCPVPCKCIQKKIVVLPRLFLLVYICLLG